MQLNGVQLNTKPGMDFNTQYNVPDTGLTQKTTLPDLINNLLKVNFNGKQTDNIGNFANSDIFQQNGLKQNPDKIGWIG
ncbi:MAG: hypothetical protein K2F57_02250 [Candidatus Gastranaerophilales bacterium]|nr:hypothetical protein [Candidatus Gastranaerophilales bacterium]